MPVLPNRSTNLRYTYKTEPYSHQKKALNKLLKLNGKGALLMEMGTGKTKVAIDWAGIGFYNWEVRRVLVVAPLSVLGVWPRQIKQHSTAPSRVFRLEGATVDRISKLRWIIRHPDAEKITYLVINYEGLWRENDKGVKIEALLKKWQPDIVIFDESHRLKNPTSKQSKAGYRISLSARMRLLLTGTHVTKAPLDVYGQFRAMEPKVFGTNWYAFKYTYGVWGGFGKYQLRGYRNLRDLITKVRGNSFRIRKEQCLDLPLKIGIDPPQTVPISLNARAQQLYTEMAKQMIVEIEETHATAPIVLTKLMRLSQITSGFIKDVEGNIRIFDDGKLNTCMDLIHDLLDEEHKVVVWVRFITDLERLSERLDKAGIKHEKLSGSVPPRQRDSLIERFQTNPNVKVFVSQIATGSEGIELFAADSVIYYSLSHSALHYWQSQDRVHRPGQMNNVNYFHLIVPRSVDSLMLTDLVAKKNIADTVLHKPMALLGL